MVVSSNRLSPVTVWKCRLKGLPHSPLKHIGVGVEIQVHVFLILGPDKCVSSESRFNSLNLKQQSFPHDVSVLVAPELVRTLLIGTSRSVMASRMIHLAVSVC